MIRELASIIVLVVLQLRRVARAQLVDREADEIQRIFDLVRQCAGELAERGEALEPVELGLALARAAQLVDHLVEAAREQSDLVAPMRLGHRFEAARRDVLRGGGDRVNRLDVAIGQHVGEDQPDREDRQRDRQQVDAMLLERPREVGEIGHHLDVAEQVVLDFDRDQVDGLLAAPGPL